VQTGSPLAFCRRLRRQIKSKPPRLAGDGAPLVGERVAELGAQVVITGRRQSEGRLLVNEIKRSGSAAFIQADLSQPEQVKADRRAGGSIVNTASVGGLLAFPTAGPYVASKHAVLGLTETAAIECGGFLPVGRTDYPQRIP
jgi:NAD(P)-dependent dehydrogenase (short-subunit alcohol dehydrogenase family)